jgi:hypothetical protein
MFMLFIPEGGLHTRSEKRGVFQSRACSVENAVLDLPSDHTSKSANNQFRRKAAIQWVTQVRNGRITEFASPGTIVLQEDLQQVLSKRVWKFVFPRTDGFISN